MQHFRTILPPGRAPFDMAAGEQVLFWGSCFSDLIGGKMAASRAFGVMVNPFGTVYNPVSMARALSRLAAGNVLFEEQELFAHAGLWNSWEHSHLFSLPERAATLRHINEQYAVAASFLRLCRHVVLTLGTATVHCLRPGGYVVANNHKMPADTFDKRLLGVSETVECLENTLRELHDRNPDLHVTLTVSPIRHLRDGFVDNQRSKAVLVLACAELCARLPFVYYFPSYELLLDDLRDYRFYAPDMLHPSDMAVEYIWQYFEHTFFSENTRDLLAQTTRLQKALQHRPFNPDTPEHRAFVQVQTELVKHLQHNYPAIDWSWATFS